MKILFIHATAGAGHFKAAEALYHGLPQDSSHQTLLVDSLDYTSPAFKKLYRESYSFLVTKTPWAWKFFFGLLDIDCLQPLVRGARRIYNGLNARPLEKFLKEMDFDYIVSTHFLSNEVAAYLKRTGKIHSKIIGVVTDFDVHKIWLAKGIDYYCVASPWTKEKMKKLGVEETRVIVSGIPTDEKFAKVFDVAALKQNSESLPINLLF